MSRIDIYMKTGSVISFTGGTAERLNEEMIERCKVDKHGHLVFAEGYYLKWSEVSHWYAEIKAGQ